MQELRKVFFCFQNCFGIFRKQHVDQKTIENTSQVFHFLYIHKSFFRFSKISSSGSARLQNRQRLYSGFCPLWSVRKPPQTTFKDQFFSARLYMQPLRPGGVLPQRREPCTCQGFCPKNPRRRERQGLFTRFF